MTNNLISSGMEMSNENGNVQEAGQVINNSNNETMRTPISESESCPKADVTMSEELISQSITRMRNLLFIEGNRNKIDKSNVIAAYNKIKALGFIETMPMEYIPMDKAIDKLTGRKLFKPTIVRKTGEGDPTISNFEVKLNVVSSEEYMNYDGVCMDGQHRSLALMFSTLGNTVPTYMEIHIPETMDILSYVALRNNGKIWVNNDFYGSSISTDNDETDHILAKRGDGYDAAFLFPIYTLGTATLKPNQIKAILLGYKKLSDFGKIQLNLGTRKMGDKILDKVEQNAFLSKDRLTGRFASGLKLFYQKMDSDFDKVMKVLEAINKNVWETHFTANIGHSMEIKAYAEAFEAVYIECNN